MAVESKIKNLNDDELKTQEAQTGEQLFRLRFNKALGNTEGTKKLRGLRKDIARIKTETRARALGIAKPVASETAAPAKKTKKAKA